MKKIISFALCIALMFIFCGSALGVGNNDEQAEAYNQELSSANEDAAKAAAVSYLTDCSRKMYMYEDIDLENKTIKSADSAKLNDGVNLSASEAGKLYSNIDYIKNVAEYYSYTRSAMGITRADFKQIYKTSDTNISADGASATVGVHENLSFYYTDDPDMDEVSCIGTDYVVYLLKINGDWYVSDITDSSCCSVFPADKSAGFNLASEKEKFDSVRSQTNSDTPVEIIAPDMSETRGTIYESITYNKQNAVAYAKTYTEESGNDSTSKYNTNFPYYYGVDCANYASQCMWAGFSGSNDSTAISYHYIPMDDVGSYKWYSGIVAWNGTISFGNYMASSNANSGETRVTSTIAIIGESQNFSSISNYLTALPGSVLMQQTYSNNNGWENNHAMVITKVNGSSRNLIYVCAHTNNHLNIKLSDMYSTDRLQLYMPTSFVRVSTCTGTAHSYSSYSAGTDSTCNNCSYCRLITRGTLLEPMSAGTTRTVSGSANINCYRMAIGITAPNGTTTWSEQTSTASISRSYTFSTPGLYTIVINARDISDTISSSTTRSNTFVVRVT